MAGDKNGGGKGPPKFKYEGGHIRLDKEGRWFHDGVEITHDLTRDLFSQSVKKREEGEGYCLEIGLECAEIEVEDTPFVIKRATLDDKGATLLLSDKTEERLDPGTLRVGSDNVLYCDVKGGEFPARFLRPAYYQLMEALVETESGYAARLGGELWPISMEDGGG